MMIDDCARNHSLIIILVYDVNDMLIGHLGPIATDVTILNSSRGGDLSITYILGSTRYI